MQTKLMTYARIWGIAFVAYLLADYLLHGFLLLGLDHSELKGVVLEKPNLIPLFLYYLDTTFIFTVVLMASRCSLARIKQTIAMAVALGFALNVTVHLINLAVLPKWSVPFAVADTLAVLVEDVLLALFIVWLARLFKVNFATR